MLALRIRQNGLAIQQIPDLTADGEALIRVLKSGICGTDLELVKGYSGFQGTPGHEFVGQVESSTKRPELTGKRVVGEINVGCGECAICATGDPRHCPRRTVLGIVGRDGAHAEFLRLPERNLHIVPDNVTNEDAVFVEPLAAAMGMSERFDFGNAETVAVIGDGKLGILCARALAGQITQGHVTLVGRNDAKLRLASAQKIEAVRTDQTSNLRRRFDVVVEASGSESGFEAALELVRPRGTIVLKSTYHGIARWDTSLVVVNEITVVGSRCGRFEPAIGLLSSNQIRVDDLISEEFSLSHGVEAYNRAAAKGVMKVLLDMSD
jgi:threonine dehydrogenase-like Zn-dependent dehydrogenase